MKCTAQPKWYDVSMSCMNTFCVLHCIVGEGGGGGLGVGVEAGSAFALAEGRSNKASIPSL